MLLLDTHIYLWFVTDDDRLPPDVKATIESEELVFVSMASFWELAIKVSTGKMDLPKDIVEMIADCDIINIKILPIRAFHFRHLADMPFIHRDPFDRLLISQAMEDGLTLVTVDSNILKYPSVKTMFGG